MIAFKRLLMVFFFNFLWFYFIKANHVCLKENAVPICPGTDLSWYRTFLVPNCLFQRVPNCLDTCYNSSRFCLGFANKILITTFMYYVVNVDLFFARNRFCNNIFCFISKGKQTVKLNLERYIFFFVCAL